MRIIVCIKQVPRSTEIDINPLTNTLIREGGGSMMNPFDAHALETALALREDAGGSVAVLTMGPPQALSVIYEAMAMGADEGFLVTDREFAGSDTLATAYILSAAVRKTGLPDLIICGKQAVDGDTAQVGPEIAENLGLPQVTNLRRLDLGDGSLTAERATEDGCEVIMTQLPALISIGRMASEPRWPALGGFLAASSRGVTVWGAADLDIDRERTGQSGSPTRVTSIFPPQRTSGGIIFEGTAERASSQLTEIIRALAISAE